MTAITRRAALAGAGAAVAVAGVPGAVLGEDAHIETLYRIWREAYVEHLAAHDRSAALLSGDPEWHAADRAVTRTGYQWSACLDKLLEANAHTIPGVLMKVRAIVEDAEDGAGANYSDALEVIKADLERLAVDFERLLGGMRP